MTRIDVPGELSIIGHDDSPIAELLVPVLSSTRQDHDAIRLMLAQTALTVVDEASFMPEPEGIVSLILRDATAPPRA